MGNRSTTLQFAALFLFASAFLHMVVPLLAGFNVETLVFATAGLVLIVIGLGLLKNMRWLAWLTFFAALIGGIVSLNGAMTPTVIPNWVYASIMTADWLCAAMLFFHLWKARSATA